MQTTIVFWGYIGLVEKKMETCIIAVDLLLRVAFSSRYQ